MAHAQTASCGAATSFLFAPADRPDRVHKAVGSQAHAVIADLEDGVAGSAKQTARDALAGMRPDRGLLVRVNARTSPEHQQDLATVLACASVYGIVLPKVESADDVVAVVEACTAAGRSMVVLALVETATGVLALPSIARSGVHRLVFGSADYLADIGAESSAAALAAPRSMLVIASAAALLPPPVDGPCLQLSDTAEVRNESAAARALGMSAKLCIHPSQLDAVHETFAPTDDELVWARRVVEAHDQAGGGAIALDGRMIDEPVVRRARRLLDAPITAQAGEAW